MTIIYVAKSASLQTWASDVGLTKHLYKIGITEIDAPAAIAALNANRFAGRSDWTMVKQQRIDNVNEADALSRLGQKETAIDSTYYPQLKGAEGIFKIKPVNVENHFIIESALAGRERKNKRLTSGEIGLYLIRNALGTGAETADA